MELTGAQALIKSLEQQGVDTIFGLPGGAILPVYDPLIDSSIRHILVRHEQGAGHMAEGYALATGRPGVAMVTSGPGRHEHRHPYRQRPHGLDAARRGHRTSRLGRHWHRRIPRVRHHGHHDGHHQAQLPREVGPGNSSSGRGGVSPRHDRTARVPYSSTCPRTSRSR